MQQSDRDRGNSLCAFAGLSRAQLANEREQEQQEDDGENNNAEDLRAECDRANAARRENRAKRGDMLQERKQADKWRRKNRASLKNDAELL